MVDSQTFENVNFELLEKGTYEECTFINCDFTSISLAFFKFENCSFDNCNLSNVSVNQTSFQDCEFTSSKLTGINFEDATPFLFEINCIQCDLSYTYFAENDLKRSQFKNCKFENAQFVNVNAKEVDFSDCNFSLANFDQCELSAANFIGVKGLSVNILTNKVKKLKIERDNLPGLLDSFDLNIIE